MADRERLVSGTGGDVLALAEELAAEFADRAGAIDREGRFPHENIARLKETGYLSLPIPEDLGGRGADLATVCRAQSIL
ncbi:MAG: acyl-CoA dehydrogenase family protein, partial [Acidimicrobiia bacterium]